jgi:hypothetical protein
MYSEFSALSARFYDARLDDTEQAALIHLLLLETMSSVLEKPQVIARYVNETFRKLQMHYEQNYDDIPIRLGELVLLLQEIQRIRRIFDEHVIVMKLCGKQTVLEKYRRECCTPSDN